MNIVAEYIKYHLKGRNRHGIHSPFVFELSDKVLQQEISPKDNDRIVSYRKKLAHDNKVITITDHGSGSKTLGRNRKIKDIYRVSSSKGKYGKLLYLFAKNYKPKNILELGTSLGIGSFYMYLGNKESNITTIEGCPETANYTRQMFDEFDVGVTIKSGTFKEIIPTLNEPSFDLIFIDGHHNGKATMDYLLSLDKFISDDTIVIFDDIRWSTDMFDTWQEIIQNKKFHVTIDFFRMGIAIKRPIQTKEHFILKF